MLLNDAMRIVGQSFQEPDEPWRAAVGQAPWSGRSCAGALARDREAKSSELIEAARYVIARDGYAGASLLKVAARAGYSTGAVTYYFANKE
jgi:TetR/AcrR family transcriptional regulator, transcriptional repressor of aconitase